MQSGKIHIFVQAQNIQLCMYGWGAEPELLRGINTQSHTGFSSDPELFSGY